MPLFALALLGLVSPEAAHAQVAFQGVVNTLASVPSGYPIQASLNAVAADSVGNVYAIESSRNESNIFAQSTYSLLKFSPQPGGGYSQTTLASNPSDTFGGVAVDTAGDVYYTDTTASAVIELTPSGSGYNASTLNIAVSQPAAIAVGANGNLYLASYGAGAVYEEVYSAGAYSQITVLSGGVYASAVAVDQSGNVYVTQGNVAQFLVFTNNGDGTFAQSSVPVNGPLPYRYPISLAVDLAGDVFLSDENSALVDEFIFASGNYTEIPLAGGQYGAQVALGTAGNLIIASQNNIEEFQPTTASFGWQPTGAAPGTSTDTISLPFTVAAGQTVASVNILTTGIAGLDFTDAGSSTCTAQTYANATNCVVNVNFSPLVPGSRHGAVVLSDGSGNVLASVPVYGTGVGPQVAYPASNTRLVAASVFSSSAIAVDAAGNVFASATSASINAQGVVKIAPGGSETVLSTDNIGALAIDGAGNLYFGDNNRNSFLYMIPDGATQPLPYSSRGTQALTFTGAGDALYATRTQAFLLLPSGYQTLLFTVPSGGMISSLAEDLNGNVYIGDSVNNVVYQVAPSGAVSTAVSGLSGVQGVAVDPAGNLYVSEFNRGYVDEVTPAGVVTQLTTGANAPYAVALDQNGNVYYSDWFTNSIYEIVRTTPLSLSFAATQQGTESYDSPRAVSLQNTGDAALSFSAIAYPADFPEDASGTTDCSVAAPTPSGSTCTLTVDFKPVAPIAYPGSSQLNESVSLTTNIPSNPSQTVAVTGSEIAAESTVATPTFSLPSGTYNNTQTVTITDATPGATIYYTFNGTTPTTASPVYRTPLAVGNSVNLQAFAVAPNHIASAVAASNYSLAVATPVISVSSGTYSTAQTVTFSSASTGAILFYSIGGSIPTPSSKRYTGPITVSASETLTVVGAETGYASSAPVSATYYISAPPAAPVFSPAGGAYASSQTITLSDVGTNATFYYTVDGSTPTASSPKYTTPIPMTNGLTLKAIASVPGYGLGPVGSASYVLTAATPTASPAAGTYATAQPVTLTSATPGATIFYTLNGNIPGSSSTVYTGPINVNATETLKFIALKTGFNASPVVSALYYISAPPATPTFSITGGTFNNPVTVSISESVPAATIFYTINGTTPTAASNRYIGPIQIGANLTVNALAIEPGYTNPSPVATAIYNLVAATPVVSLASGTYTGQQTVTVTSATAGSTIFYTTNGLVPTANANHYTGPITVSSSETLTFLAAKTGYTSSSPVSVSYTIQ